MQADPDRTRKSTLSETNVARLSVSTSYTLPPSYRTRRSVGSTYTLMPDYPLFPPPAYTHMPVPTLLLEFRAQGRRLPAPLLPKRPDGEAEGTGSISGSGEHENSRVGGI